MRYPQGCLTTIKTADGSVYSGTKNVYSLIIAYKGATAGDEVALRKTGATGDVMVYAVVPGTEGTLIIDLGRFGVEIADCYYTEQAAAGNTIETTIIHTP